MPATHEVSGQWLVENFGDETRIVFLFRDRVA